MIPSILTPDSSRPPANPFWKMLRPSTVCCPGEYGFAADVWGLGCLMLQMIELSLPHGEDFSDGVRKEHIK